MPPLFTHCATYTLLPPTLVPLCSHEALPPLPPPNPRFARAPQGGDLLQRHSGDIPASKCNSDGWGTVGNAGVIVNLGGYAGNAGLTECKTGGTWEPGCTQSGLVGSSTCQHTMDGNRASEISFWEDNTMTAIEFSVTEPTACYYIIKITIPSVADLATYTCSAGEVIQGGSCVPCSAGTFSTNGACEPCPPGKYSSSAGSTVCSECERGTYSTGGAQICDDCDPGSYADFRGAGACTLCRAGKYIAESGSSTECADCAEGLTSTSGADGCYDPREVEELFNL